MDFNLPEELQVLKDTVRKFVDRELIPLERECRPEGEDMVQCQSGGVPAGVVQTGADLLQDVQLRHRNYFSPFADSLIGPFEIPRSGFLFRGVNEEPLRLPNRLGADNDPILSELLGYDQATIEQWRQEEILT